MHEEKYQCESSHVHMSPDAQFVVTYCGNFDIDVFSATSGRHLHKIDMALRPFSVRFVSSPTDQLIGTNLGTIVLRSGQAVFKRLSLSEDRSWITWNQTKLLFLPADYRLRDEVQPMIRIEGMMVAIARVSVKVILMHFSLPSTVIPSGGERTMSQWAEGRVAGLGQDESLMSR